MSRLAVFGRATLVAGVLFAVACRDAGNDGDADAAADLALPPQVTHVGADATACCLETTSAAWRVLYLSQPQPGGSDARGRDVATKGELHLADAYGTDLTLATQVPRNGYQFSPDGRFVFFLAPSGNKDKSYALKIGAVAADTLGSFDPITVIDHGLDDQPLEYQSFYSPTGKYLILGVAGKGSTYSTDLVVVEIETSRVLFTLPDGAFNYIEAVTSNDVLVYLNSTASKVVGVPSRVGLYALPIGSAQGGGVPALIDDRTVTFSLTADERRVVYSRYDGSVWLYDLVDKSRVKLASGAVSFTVGSAVDGPLVWVGSDLAVHVTPLLQDELLATPARATDVHSPFLFSPSRQDLFIFNQSSAQDSNGDLYRLSLKPGALTSIPQLLERRVSHYDFTFVGGRVRYLRGVDGHGDVGELVSANIDGTDPRPVAEGVAVGSLLVANPRPVEDAPVKGNPTRGAVDLSPKIIPPVYAQLVDARRESTRNKPLFDESAPIIGALAFARGDAPPAIVDPAVHLGGYRYSPDGYVLAYAGGARLDTTLLAYLGSLRLFQTLVEQSPVSPVLDGVSEIGRIRERAFFVAAPGANPPGVYFVRY